MKFELLIIQNKLSCTKDFEFTRLDCMIIQKATVLHLIALIVSHHHILVTKSYLPLLP